MAIYVASMNMRRKWAERPEESIVLNVTSAQGKQRIERRDLSPMSEILGRYKGFYCFENYWQSGKVFDGIDHCQYVSWWKSLEEGKRRYPKLKTECLYSNYDGQRRDYLQSRKEIYIPEYHDLVKNSEAISKWKDIVASGRTVVIYDFDGPRTQDGGVTCLPVTRQMLKEKVNDTTFPFGHGYVVASILAEIPLSEFILFRS